MNYWTLKVDGVLNCLTIPLRGVMNTTTGGGPQAAGTAPLTRGGHTQSPTSHQSNIHSLQEYSPTLANYFATKNISKYFQTIKFQTRQLATCNQKSPKVLRYAQTGVNIFQISWSYPRYNSQKKDLSTILVLSSLAFNFGVATFW